jgi:hypothetical protein
MTARFVQVINRCRESITVFLRFPRPKKPKQFESTRFVLPPGHTSRPIPYPALVDGKNWEELNKRECVELKEVPWTPPFAAIENKSNLVLDLKLGLTKKKQKLTTVIKLEAGKTSVPIHLGSVLQKRRLKTLEKRKRVIINPHPYIGPPVGDPPAVASYGYEDVYICYDCGGPIVFRYRPPIPIHIGYSV